MSRHQRFLESQDSGETMERKFTTQYGLMYSDLVKITNYPLQTFDGADFYRHKSGDIYAWVPLLGSSRNYGRWRKE